MKCILKCDIIVSCASHTDREELIVKKEYVMGNQAIAIGALAAGVNVATGYPGTPSSEIIDTIAAHNKDKNVHVAHQGKDPAGFAQRHQRADDRQAPCALFQQVAHDD